MPSEKIHSKLVALLNTPFDLFKSKRNRLIIAFSISGFAWFFLFIFGVFEFNTFTLPYRLYYTGTYSLSCLIILLLDLFLLKDYLLKKTTLVSAFMWGLWIMFWIALSNYMITSFMFKWEEFSIYNLVKNQLYTLSIGLFVTPALILINHNYLLRKRILEVTNTSIETNQLAINQSSNEVIKIESQYKDGRFEIEINNLLYIQSSDNYIDIWFKKGTLLQHKLIRNTLNALEQKLIHPALIRCHRSFIINKNNVRSIKRYAGRYKIMIESINIEIPLSRKYKNDVFLSFGKQDVVRP